MKIVINDIKIGPRQRLDLGNITELADSLKRLGQIHNIGVNENNLLIWGRRRLEAARLLGWQEIEATVRADLTDIDEQEIELEEDIKRKNRTWQEETIAMAKLYALKSRQARVKNESFGVREMSDYIGVSTAIVSQYVFNVAVPLLNEPKDKELWEAKNFTAALEVLRARQEKETAKEMEKRHAAAKDAIAKMVVVTTSNPSSPSSVKILNETLMPKKVGMTLSLRDRAMAYNQAFSHLGPPNTDLFYSNKNDREFITGFWFVGGANISELYGSYQIEYLKRIESLFPDAIKVIHLFVGSLPPSEKYLRVGLPQGETKPDIECDAHYLSSKLPFKCDLVYADPPYSVEDSEHYQNSMVNRERILEECALVLNDNGYVVWIDQALPIFKNELLSFVGAIGYIRSTANRFRIVSIFRKAKICPTIKSSLPSESTPLPKTADFV
jgi:ParB family chromosome partitioning protein